ncbi:ABC transporter permease [Minwuia sp.]|uniref:ABC transporter permease n=1 Tax=Minwuia sp. TaxID=2493630 RepID=UPI003A8F337F
MGPWTRFKDNLARFLDGDIWHSFRTSPVAMMSTVLALVMITAAMIAPVITPQDPFEPAALDLLDASTPPVWHPDGYMPFVLGTDDQGRDMYSAILYGSRVSILVGLSSVVLAIVLGVTLGLVAGFVGGRTDAVIMRITDVQLSFPALLIALLISGVSKAVFPEGGDVALYVIVASIALSIWPQFARTVRGSTMVEKSKEYVQAARVIGVSSIAIMYRHVLPNVMGPVLVIGTINLAVAILLEATLSFLGVGVPATEPSLGTLIRIGSDFLFSGDWWIVTFPGIFLALLVVAVNLLGDWLRDALNPKLR